MTRYGLYGAILPAVCPGWCREHQSPTATPMISDEMRVLVGYLADRLVRSENQRVDAFKTAGLGGLQTFAAVAKSLGRFGQSRQWFARRKSRKQTFTGCRYETII